MNESLPMHRDPDEISLSEFSPEQRKLIELLANPERKLTAEQLAEEIGVSQTTIYRWKKSPHLIHAVNQLAYHFLQTELPEVYQSLVKKAKSGNVRAIEIMLKYVGGFVERVEHGQGSEAKATGLEHMTDAQLQALISEKARRLGIESNSGNIIDVEIRETDS